MREVDLAVRYGLVTGGLVQVLDAHGNATFSQLVDGDGNVCVPLSADSQYRIYRLRVVRGTHEHPPMRVHFKGGRENARILGIERVERYNARFASVLALCACQLGTSRVTADTTDADS